MLLYLSSAINEESYNDFLKRGLVKSGLQAQRFNSLIIEGMGSHTEVTAIGFPPYVESNEKVDDFSFCSAGVYFHVIGNVHNSKVNHFLKLIHFCISCFKKKKVEAVVCDAISPIYSLVAVLLSKFYSVPSVAIVTDIPIIMEAAHPTLITKMSQYLIQKHDGYVLLTAAMNDLVNSRRKPYIVMEGLCDSFPVEIKHEKSSDKTIVLYTGSLSLQTGIENLVEAFKLLNKDNVELWIYGGGAAEDYIKEQSRNCSTIVYGGIVSNEESACLQRKANILVNPRPTNIGYAEYSFPSKIMEYMASGTPVLTTKLAGIPVEYYDYVYSIDEDSVIGIYKSLISVLNMEEDQRKNMGEKARAFVLANKNNVKQGERILSLINQTVKNK